MLMTRSRYDLYVESFHYCYVKYTQLSFQWKSINSITVVKNVLKLHARLTSVEREHQSYAVISTKERELIVVIAVGAISNPHPPYRRERKFYSMLTFLDCGAEALGTTMLKIPFFRLALTAS
jgi:hypothetical protein